MSARTGDDPIREILLRLLLHDTFAAEALLRDYNAARRHGLNHRHGQQIRRLEQYFSQHAGRPAWPPGFQPGQLIHFREILGGLLTMAPLKIFLEDLKGEAGLRQNLLYFLSTEQGKRASRWEMLALDHKRGQYEQDKARWAKESREAYDRMFGAEVSGQPSWITRLADEARQLEHLLPLVTEDSARAEMRQRLGQIQRRLAEWHAQSKTVPEVRETN